VSHLLDSNALLWWLDDSPRLSKVARATIADRAAEIWVSAISIYELRVKARKNALQGLPGNLGELVIRQPFRELPVSIAHAEAAAVLPMHHRDPWDRLLIAQAQVEGLSIVSADRIFGRYAVRVVW
jgi:PIN domain nuclease of toxin-antitoxin system